MTFPRDILTTPCSGSRYSQIQEKPRGIPTKGNYKLTAGNRQNETVILW